MSLPERRDTNRIDRAFAACREQRRGALLPFVCAGDPSLDMLGDLLGALERGGASVIELGIPFSDPIADGPVIASAMYRALGKGVTTDAVFEAVSQARGGLDVGLTAMVSMSLVYARGVERFFRDARDAGFDGLVLPDCPLEEGQDASSAASEAGLACTLLVSPTTPDDRAAAIAKASSGFVYMLARSGITGERSDAPRIEAPVGRLRPHTRLPIAVGFGISTAEHVRAVCDHADGAIVGSALVKRLETASEAGRDVVAEAEAFASELSVGLIRMDAVLPTAGGL